MNRYPDDLQKSKLQEEEFNADSTRDYFSKLLNKSYNDYFLTNDDAVAIASLASALDQFLSGVESEQQSAITLKKNLYQIIYNDSWEKRLNIQNHKEKKSRSDTYHASDGKVVYLGTLLGSGGEGSVYKISNMPGKAAKLFKATADFGFMERKIRALIDIRIPSRLDKTIICTMPETLLYDEENQFVGYIMPAIGSRFKLFDVIRPSATRARYFPELDYKGLIIIAYNLAETIHFLHEHNVVIGDLNPGNIVIHPDGTVCMIDTDSYDIVDSGTKERFPCAVGFSELLAPELQAAGQLKGLFTKKTDDFALAIQIFRLLMNNASPFGGVAVGNHSVSANDFSTNKAIINGECPYVKKVDGIKVPDWAPSFDILPAYIQELFVRTFDYTAETYESLISQRPAAKEWMEALMRFLNEPLRHCEKDPFHWYRKELAECPFCIETDTHISAIKIDETEKKESNIMNQVSCITVEI